jgi:TolB protein
MWPACSPDGRRIVFASTRDGDPEIYVMNAAGSRAQRLTSTPGRDAHPSWSPDGKTIAFQSPRLEGHTRIFLMDADGSHQRPLTNNRGFCGVPSWSPDGKQIAFQCTDDVSRTKTGSPWQLFIVETSGGEPRRLVQSTANDQVPNWSPDGRRIIFYSDRSGIDQLYVISPNGGEPSQLTRGTTASRVASWAPDGKTVLFQSGVDGGTSDIFRMPIDGGGVTKLTALGNAQGVPAHSPDGKTLAFSAVTGGWSRIWLMNVDGTNPRMLDAGSQEPRRALLIVSFSAEDAVGLIDPDSGVVVARIHVAKNPHEITLTRDRTRAYVATTGGAQAAPNAANVITAVDVAAKKALPYLELSACASPHDARVSADGSTIWVACAPSQIVAELDARTGKVTRWPTQSDGGWFVAATPDDRKLYVPHLEGKRVTVVDRSRGAVSVALEGGAQSGIDVAPDGRSVWIIDHESGEINVLDTATDKVAARVALQSKSFGRVRFTPDGTRVLIVQDRKVTIIDAAARTPLGEIQLPFAGKVIDISPDGSRAAVTHPSDDRLSILNLDTRAVVSTIPTGKTPDGVAWIR